MKMKIVIPNMIIVAFTLAILWACHILKVKVLCVGIIIVVFVILYGGLHTNSNENFGDDALLTSINDFLTTNKDDIAAVAAGGDLNNSNLQEAVYTLNESIREISDQVRKTNTQTGIPNTPLSFNNSDNVLNDVQLYKQLQLAKLAELQKQLVKTQQLIDTQASTTSSNKYKPLKVYNSCVISEADGSYSTDL